MSRAGPGRKVPWQARSLTQRCLEPEALDALDADDPAAKHSRRDLILIHRFMGTVSILQAALRRMPLHNSGQAPLKILELGAGDGLMMLRVASRLARQWPAVELTLLDQQVLVSADTVARYAALGWTVQSLTMDLNVWMCAAQQGATDAPSVPDKPWDLVIANLVLHHFSDNTLATLCSAIAAASERFLACEPRRTSLALGASRLVGLIGANAVTRHDAVLSVRAGFRNQELSSLWHAQRACDLAGDSDNAARTAIDWQVDEYPAGPFSHCFSAIRRRAA